MITARSAQGSSRHVNVYVALLIAASLLLFWPLSRGRTAAALHFPGAWVMTTVLFIIAVSLPLRFSYKGVQRTFNPETVPFVLALIFLSPWQVVATRLIGCGVARAARRQTPLKLLFNLSATCVSTQLSLLVFRPLSAGATGIHARVWVGAFAGETTDAVLAFGFVCVIVMLTTGSLNGLNVTGELSLALPISFVCTLLALIDAAALRYDSTNAWAIAVFAVLLGLGLRTYHRLSESHAALDRLYEVARELGAVGTDPADLHPALEQLRRVIGADFVELLANDDVGRRLRTSVFSASDGVGSHVSEESAGAELPTATRRGRLSMAANRIRLLPTTEAHQISAPLPLKQFPPAILTARLSDASSSRFAPADVRLVEAAAAQLAAAIEKGELVASLRRAAERDKLTGLANLESLRSFMATAFEGGPGGVLLVLDIDRFHEINDTLGREIGDAVLSEVARRLDASPGQAGLAARVGSDQFALAIPGQASSELARLAALAVKSRTDGSMRFETVNADVRITIGIARCPEHGVTGNTLLRRAEMAMTAAKGTSAGIGEWEPSYETDGSRRIQLLAGLRQALAEGSLAVAYQPKLRLSTGEVAGFEALVRWNHPSLGSISPAEFVPLTEATGLIGALTSHVLREALSACRHWHDEGKRVGVAVNISPRSLDDPVLVGQVAAMLTASGLAPQWLTLEITESSLMENKERALDVLHQLRMLGVRLSIDDFGTGYSSLNQLRGLPAHEVKIDRSFVNTVDEGGADLAVVRAIVDLCDSMGLTTVAEGVERASQAFALESLGVPIVQGYFYGRPMPADAASTWLAARPTLAEAVDQKA